MVEKGQITGHTMEGGGEGGTDKNVSSAIKIYENPKTLLSNSRCKAVP